MSNSLKVAVIDSGIDSCYAESISSSILGGISLSSEDGKTKENSIYNDNFGHGTMSASIIKNYSKLDIKFYIVKILDDNGCCSSDILNLALKHLIDIDVDIINMSLSILSSNISDIKKVCQELNKKGRVIVSSVTNRKYSSYPAAFPFVYGVTGIVCNIDNFFYNPDRKIQFLFSAVPQIAIGLNNEYNFYSGNSKAACLASAYIINNLVYPDKYPLISQSKMLLTKKTISSLINRKMDIKLDSPFYNNNIVQEVTEIISKISNINSDNILKSKSLYNEVYDIFNNTNGFLKQIESNLKYKVNWNKLSLYNLINIFELSEYILNNRIN